MGTGTGTGIATLQCCTSGYKCFQKVNMFPDFVLQCILHHKVVKLHTSHHKCCKGLKELNQQRDRNRGTAKETESQRLKRGWKDRNKGRGKGMRNIRVGTAHMDRTKII